MWVRNTILNNYTISKFIPNTPSQIQSQLIKKCQVKHLHQTPPPLIPTQWRSQRGARGGTCPPWLHLKFLCKCKGLWHKEKERKKWLPIGCNLKMVMTQEKESKKKKKKSQTSNPFHLIYCFCRLLSCPTRLIIISQLFFFFNFYHYFHY